MPDSTSGQLVVFSLGSEEYALPIACVHEIIRFTKPRSVASEDPSVRGVISLRGRIIPVFDLATRLRVELDADRRDKIIIVETEGADGPALAGIVVDTVSEVLTFSSEHVDAEGGREVCGEAIEAIVRIDDRLIALLDAGRVVGTDTVPEAPAADAPAESAAVAA